MSKRRYYNTTDTPYTMDAAGHVLGGRESGEFDSSSQITRGLEAGKLIDRGEVEEKTEEEGGRNEVAPPEPVNPGEVIAPPEPKKKKTGTSRRGRTASEEESS